MIRAEPHNSGVSLIVYDCYLAANTSVLRGTVNRVLVFQICAEKLDPSEAVIAVSAPNDEKVIIDFDLGDGVTLFEGIYLA